MEMPMENKPHPEEWTEEWYKTWERPNTNNHSSSYSSSSGSRSVTDHGATDDSETGTVHDETSSYVEESSHSGSSYSSAGNQTASEGDFSDNDDETLEDTPQCGTLINVKPKIGERVSRIHPDYTSQLRRSRWRKKYFPRGTFPYDK